MGDLINLGIGKWTPNIQYYEQGEVYTRTTQVPVRNPVDSRYDQLKNISKSLMIARRLAFTISSWTPGTDADLNVGRLSIKGFLLKNGQEFPISSNSFLGFPSNNACDGGQAATASRSVWKLAAPFEIPIGKSIFVEFGNNLTSPLSFSSTSEVASYFCLNCVTKAGVPVELAYSATAVSGVGRIQKSFRNVYKESLYLVSISFKPATTYQLIKITSDIVNFSQVEKCVNLGLSSNWQPYFTYDVESGEVVKTFIWDFSEMPQGGQLLLPDEGFLFKVTLDGSYDAFHMILSLESYIKS